MNDQPAVYGFVHVATLGAWEQIVSEQLRLIRQSGLWDRTTRLFFGVVGPHCHSFNPEDEKIEVLYRSRDLGEFEFPTLKSLHRFCASSRCYVYYIHTKGVSHECAPTTDWRSYMEYFVLERYEECLHALQTFDLCGVNWHRAPWPHYSGNFWWARSEYVTTLKSIEELPPPMPERGHGRRHQCERWIGSGESVKAASLHQSHLHHYLSLYPRQFYAGPAPEQCVSFPRRRTESSAPRESCRGREGGVSLPEPSCRQVPRLAIIFDNLVRPDTTGIYCLRALRRLARVSHYLPCEIDCIPEGIYDLFIFVDDGLDHELGRRLSPSALWAIDTHLTLNRLVRYAASMDYAFAAQQDGVSLLRERGINCLGWLPLACDPEVHARHEVPKELDVCFIANLSTGRRRELAKLIRSRFTRSFVGQRYFEDMALTYSKSRIALNLSIRKDVNMRCFEALGCGTFLLTDDANENGMGKLLRDGEHLVVFQDDDDLLDKIEFYLANPAQRERIAIAGREEVLARHTYVHRMHALIDSVACQLQSPLSKSDDVKDQDRTGLADWRETTIIIPTFNQIDYTRQCLESIRRHTRSPYRIVVVDNGSTDGTVEYLRTCNDLTLIENQRNTGFAAAVNQGIASDESPQLVLLNNDTIVTEGWLDRMLEALHSDPHVGIVGPCSNQVPGPQRVKGAPTDVDQINEFAQVYSTEHHARRVSAEVLVGFCMLIRRSVIKAIGDFDESFGIGTYEDYDFCRRAATAGYRLLIARDAYVHHFGSVTLHSSGIDVEQLLQRNEQMFWLRHAPAKQPMSIPSDSLTSIVIVTFNAIDCTKLCLESLGQFTDRPHEIIVVDNGSTDGTCDYLRSLTAVQLIENAGNRGFPAAANQGIAASRGAQIVLLNNDVVVTPGWLAKLQSALWSAEDIGLVGPCSNEVSGEQRIPIDYHDISGAIDFAARWASEHRGESCDTDRLVGFCLMARREVFNRVGLLDERFGIGNFEDDDFCIRARLHGYRATIVRDCYVHHIGSASFKQNGFDYAAILGENQRRFSEKWNGMRRLPPADAKEIGDQLVVRPPDGPRLSLCMIVRDAERTLSACLASARPWMDEIIVVDTGSRDRTPEIAREFGARVSQFQWCDDFSTARNESIKPATGDWLFWMDSDDTIDEVNGRRLRELIERGHPATTLGFVLQVHCPVGSSSDPYSTSTVVDHVKLFRNHAGIRFSGRIHEQVIPAIRSLGGEVQWTDIFVVHSGSDTTPSGRARKQQRDLRLLELELSDKPDDTFALFNMGMTLLDCGRAADALNYLSRSLQMAQEGDSHLRKIYALLAQAYYDLARRETAVRTCMQGLRVFPSDPELLFRYGVLHQAMGQVDVAEQAYRRILDSPPDRHFSSVDRGIVGIKAWHNLALVYELQNRFSSAADAWRHVLDYDQRNPLAWRGLINALSAQDDTVALEAVCSPANSANIPLEASLLAHARLLTKAQGAQAAALFLRGSIGRVQSLELLDELCELAFCHNLNEIAEDALTMLVSRHPENPAAHLNLATLHLRRGNAAGAIEHAKRSLQLRPDCDEARAILANAARSLIPR